MKQLIHDLLSRRHAQHALRRLRWLERKLPTPMLRFAVPPAFRGRGHFKSMRIMQNAAEILPLYEVLLRERPGRIIEIGTALGGTLYLWTQAASDNAVLVSIDLPGGPFGGGYPPCRATLYQGFCRAEQRLHLLRCDAQRPDVPPRVRELLRGGEADFLFIDADHRFEGVCRNLRLYAPLVRPGGLIALHDILPNPRDASIGVWRLWERLRGLEGARELVGDESSGRAFGIGLLRVGSEGAKLILDAIHLDGAEARHAGEGGVVSCGAVPYS